MKKFETLSNSFHGTTVRVRSAQAARAALEAAEPTPAQRKMAAKIRSRLCGTSGCRCGVIRN